MPKPNLFVIGAPKCGTSALCQYLAEHENVFFSDPKEPFYLCDDFPRLKEQHFLSQEADYLSLFAAADPVRHSVIGEGSTNYLRSETAVANALALSPDARFILMLRDPVEMVHAWHMELVFSRNETETDFETAWRLQEARRRGEAVPETCRAEQFLQYREMAAFADQVARFFARVPEERRLVLLQEDLKSDPQAVYERSLAFLGLPPDGRTEFPRVNASRVHRFEWLAKLVLTPPGPLKAPMWRLRGALRRSKPPAVEALKRYLRKPQSRDPLRRDFRTELREAFADDVARTAALIGRDLSRWLPDGASAEAPHPRTPRADGGTV